MTAPTVTQRWWAPAAPGIGPDEFDLDLFTAGDAPEQDLGQYVLALHRVGAAACEAVATQPLADEVTLRGVLATAREMVAPPAVQAVSKAFDTPAYGALLLKDLLDDAEQAAVGLYRTCITKQMAPSMAAHRVGLVYGVPLRELGRYTAFATDPKANKDAVQELADRTLFTFVGKVLADEAPTGAKELVSKAPVRDRDRTQTNALQALFDRSEQRAAPQTLAGDGDGKKHTNGEQYLDEHNVEHGPAGRFQREGTGAPARPKVGRPKIGRPKIGRPQVTRPQGLAPAGTVPAGQTRTPQGTARAGTTRSGTESLGLSAAGQRVQGLLPDIEIPPVSSGFGHDLPEDVNYLERVPDRNAGEYTQLWNSVSFVFPTDEWNARKAGMALSRDEDNNEQLVFRAHALSGGGPLKGDDDNGNTSAEHDEARASVAEAVHARSEHEGQPPPVVLKLTNAEDILRNPSELRKAKLNFLETLQDKLGRRLVFDREIAFVHEAADRDNPEDLVLVWTPPTPGRNPFSRPVKQVTEVFIDEEDAQGYAELSGNGTDITVDPNQPLKVLGKRKFWVTDEHGGYLLHQLEAHGAYEDEVEALAKDRARRRKKGFGKRLVVAKAVSERNAAQLQQIQALFDQAESTYLREHNVDNAPETGRFERVGRPRVGRPKIGRPSAKPHLLGTTGARGLQAPAGQQAAGVERAGTEFAGLDRAGLEEAAGAAKAGQSEQTVFLDDAFHYHVLDTAKLGFILDDSNLKYLEESYEGFVPGFGSQAMILNGREINNADGARMELVTEAELRFRDSDLRRGSMWKPLGGTFIIDSDKDIPAIAMDLEDRLGRDEHVQMLRAVIHKRSDGSYAITVHGNATDMGDGHMVRMEPGSTGPVTLRYEGARRLMDAKAITHWLNVRFHGGRHIGATGSTDYLPVPLVHTWMADDHYDAP